MKHVSILVPKTAVPATIVNPRYLFSAINMFFSEAGHQPFFSVDLVGAEPDIDLNDGILTMHVDKSLDDVGETDLIIIPAISGDIQHAIDSNRALNPWIIDRYKEGAEVASLCIGAFLLAETGLVNGLTCSTHWLFANEFRRRYPEVTLVDQRVVTDQNGTYSSGGANSHWNLLMYLVEKYVGREMAITASKFFVARYGAAEPTALCHVQRPEEPRRRDDPQGPGVHRRSLLGTTDGGRVGRPVLGRPENLRAAL